MHKIMEHDNGTRQKWCRTREAVRYSGTGQWCMQGNGTRYRILVLNIQDNGANEWHEKMVARQCYGNVGTCSCTSQSTVALLLYV